MNVANSDFNTKYNYSLTKPSAEAYQKLIEDSNKIRNGQDIPILNDVHYSGVFSYRSNNQGNSPLLFSSSDVHNQRTLGLNSTDITKVDVVTRLQSDSEAVNTIINNNIIKGVKEVFTRFGVNTNVNLAIKTYQENEPLSQVNALVSQGINVLQKTGVDSKTLDKFLYQLSLSIDEQVTHSKEELSKSPIFAEQIFTQEKSSIFQSDIPTLRVWQSRDISDTVVQQTFDIKNEEGDVVKISARYVQKNSINTDEFNTLRKGLDVTITEGRLSVDEQKQFNLFLDDFAKVTNEILSGDLTGANQAFDTLNASDYGFQSITKDDTSWSQISDEEVIHSYNEALGHVQTGGYIATEEASNVVDKSYIRGGQYHNMRRNTESNLADFDIVNANSNTQPSSGISANYRSDQAQDNLYGLSLQYGKSNDGLVLQNEQGELYQYQYNEKNRAASGWTQINSEDINYRALKESQTFNSFQLNTQGTEQITLTHLPTNSIKDYSTSMISEIIDKQYSSKYDQEIFEDESGNLYQYQFNGNYQNSGWLQIESSLENQQLLQSRQDKEGYMQKYLTTGDQKLNNLQFASLVNFRERKHTADININMQLLN